MLISLQLMIATFLSSSKKELQLLLMLMSAHGDRHPKSVFFTVICESRIRKKKSLVLLLQ